MTCDGDGDWDNCVEEWGRVGMGIISTGTVGDEDKSCPRAALYRAPQVGKRTPSSISAAPKCIIMPVNVVVAVASAQ